jgi:membrane protein YdbS with pleckstrin-like domain
MSDRRFPPFTQIGMASLALIVAGGIYLSSQLPQHVALGPAIVLLAASVVLLTLNLASLRRVEAFAWPRFLQVAKWALLAYAVTAGMILYAFLRDHVSGGPLVILTLSLIVYALQVPTLIAFTVARFDIGEDGDMDRAAT